MLVHGTFENQNLNWRALSPLLKNNGYCVFALNYGGYVPGPFRGTGDIPQSAQQLDAFVDSVRAATGAAKVDVVGHSQGGMMPRWYLKFLGGASEVNALVGLSPSNHGTTLLGLGLLAERHPGRESDPDAGCPACDQQIVGSSFLSQLNSGGDTVPGVSYTVIQTRNDEVVTPYTSAFLSGSGRHQRHGAERLHPRSGRSHRDPVRPAGAGLRAQRARSGARENASLRAGTARDRRLARRRRTVSCAVDEAPRC